MASDTLLLRTPCRDRDPVRDESSIVSPNPVAADPDIALSTFLWSCALVLLLSSVLRLWDLGSVPLWKDEAFTVLAGRLPLNQILFNEIDNHPPLIYVIEHAWLMLFPDLRLARVPMAAAGIATVAVVLLATSDLYSRRAALWAGLLLAVSTGHIYFSQDARMYPLLVLGLSLASWGCAGMLSPGHLSRNSYAGLYLFGGLIAIYTHLCGLIYLFSINAALVILFVSKPAFRRPIRGWALVNMMLGLCSIPWLIHISRTVGNFPGLGVDSTGPMVVAFFLRNALGYAGLPRWIEPPILALLTLLAVAGLLAGRRSGNRPLTTVCGAGLFVYPVLMLVANEKTPILAARIFIPSVVPLVTLAGLALAQCSLPWLRRSIGLSLAACALYGSVSEHLVRTKRDNLSAALVAASKAGYRDAPVVACHFFDAAGVLLAQEAVNAPGELFTWVRDSSLMRFDKQHFSAVNMTMAGLRTSTPEQIDQFLGGGYLVGGGLEALAAKTDRLVIVTAPCSEILKMRMHQILIGAGFELTGTQQFTRSGRVVMESGETETTLYARK